MPTLTDDIKTFIVNRLAQYDTPSEVVEAVGVDFGIEITRQQVHAYDPACAKPPAQRWCDLYAATRRAFVEDAAAIGIAQKTFRLRVLDGLTRYAVKYHRRTEAAAFLVQAAKECGGLYDRRTAVAPAASQQPNALEAAKREIDDTVRPAAH